MNKEIISVIGLGIVGNAIYQSLKNIGFTENINLIGYDKYKNGGINSLDDILISNILFLALPTKYSHILCSFDKTDIIDTCDYLSKKNYTGIIIIKSTIEPESSDNIADTFPNLSIIHSPEYLSSKTAYEDFHNQKNIFLGKTQNCSETKIDELKCFFSKYYPNAEISTCTSTESESMKIFCNSFYSVKVQFFTELYLLTQKNNTNYNKIIELMIKNGWINEMHTKVPGTDGQISYGGLCFPKDTNALNNYMINYNSNNDILSACINERNKMRDDNDNIK